MQWITSTIILIISYVSIAKTNYCPFSEEFRECESACFNDSCGAGPSPDLCTRQCAIGCYCISGYCRNSQGLCQKEKSECSKNEEYLTCESACRDDSCDATQSPELCTDQCAIGCYCKPGYCRNWDGVCELPPECPNNEQYLTCASACLDDSCNAGPPPDVCTLQCVIGCYCKDGYCRNSDGVCDQLPPECPKNEEYQTCESACRNDSCQSGPPPEICTDQCAIGCYCKPGYCRNSKGECKIGKASECPKHEEYLTCESACRDDSCNAGPPPDICTFQCAIGCYCKPGYCRNSQGKCKKENSSKCPKYEQYQTCESACRNDSCNAGPPPEVCTEQCVVGCYCEPGCCRNAKGKCTTKSKPTFPFLILP